MSTVIYLANQQVQIVTGSGNAKSLNVKNCITEEAPEGSIINGMVMNAELFEDFIKSLRVSKKIPEKDVVLVVNSTKFVGKTVELPVMNDKKTVNYLMREYQDSGRSEKSLIGYISLLKEKKFKKIYSEGIEPDFIQYYIDIFARAGVKLNGIYSGEGTLIGFTKITANPHMKTFMLLVADANTLTTVLWVNGTFNYYNSVRCFHEQGTPEYADDIARSVSQINQFMKSNQIEEHLEKIFLNGIDSEYIPMCAEAIANAGVMYPVQEFEFKSAGKVNPYQQKYIRAVAGLIEYDKTSNYITRYQSMAKNKDEEKSESSLKTILLIASVIVIMAGSFGAAWYIRDSKQAELDKLIKKNTSPTMLENLRYYEEIMARNAFLVDQHNSIVGLSENLETYPRGNSKTLKVLVDCAVGYADIYYDSFDAESGYISIVAVSEDVESINQFIKILTEQEIFNKVDYTGYAYDENTGMWNINVTCTLAESAGL